MPPESGVWGRVVPLAHLPAHDAIAGLSHGARPLSHPREPMGDGPEDVDRLRCACALLDACGAYFTRGSGRRKMEV